MESLLIEETVTGVNCLVSKDDCPDEDAFLVELNRIKSEVMPQFLRDIDGVIILFLLEPGKPLQAIEPDDAMENLFFIQKDERGVFYAMTFVQGMSLLNDDDIELLKQVDENLVS